MRLRTRPALIALTALGIVPLFGFDFLRPVATDVQVQAWEAPGWHLRLERSFPADSSVVAAPKSVQLWFSQATELGVTRVLVRSAAGDTVATSPLRRDAAPRSPIEAPFTGTLAPGAYTVDWRTMAGDGHVVRGTFMFTVRAPAR
ncbi:MAG: copper resistance CopC family protein [Gemmatimonadaceae bacterium]